MNTEKYLKIFHSRSLYYILIIALFFRIVASIFSQGYGFHDDHFLVIEAAQSWVDGTDYNNWLPESQLNAHPNREPKPQGHSFFYVGLHYLFLGLLDNIGVTFPKTKMYFVRLLHALISLIIVFFGYKITRKLSNEKNAIEVGLLFALFWFMPFFSVRNLVEFFCIPFLFIAVWYLYKEKKILLNALWAGVFAGLAFSVRYQVSFFILGIGLALLIKLNWKQIIGFSIGTILSIVLVQGIVDYFIWGKPFQELTEYIIYNLKHKNSYGSNNLSMYFLVVLGLLIPPLSLFWGFGFLRTWKKHLIIFLPTLLFFAFHTYFPNKQERFIIPIIPFILLLGVIGWNEFYEKSKFWMNNKKLMKGFKIFFWSLNIILLIVFSFTYSKKSRVEAMVYLANKGDVKAVLCEDTNNSKITTLPCFYLDRWVSVYKLPKAKKGATKKGIARSERITTIINSLEFFEYNPSFVKPNYFVFYEDVNLEQRVKNVEEYFPDITYEATIYPGNIDILMRKMNPANSNQTIYIYSLKD